jgi:Mrp family chromosome partitioning ATPase/capsular polysaccharide biosynthesis protein
VDARDHLASSTVQEGPFGSYARAVRAHRALVALAMLAALAGSVAWLAVRDPEYRATARLLIDPASSDDEVLLGLPLVRDAGDPTRTAQTAAALLESPRAAAEVARGMGNGATAQSVLDAVTIEPAGQSNILAVTAAADSAHGAARLANSFADAALADRDAQLVAAVDAALAQPAARAAGAKSEPGAEPFADRAGAARLTALRRSGDPTVSPAGNAVVPVSPSGAPWWLVLALALICGAVIGGVAALVAELRSPRRLADEEELLERIPHPVLARLPEDWHRFAREPGMLYPTPSDVAFRSLQVHLGLLDGARRTVMVSSPGEDDGKSTLLTSLAFRLAREGQRVIVLDLDLHAPCAADLLGMPAEGGLAQLLESRGELGSALVPVSGVRGLAVLPGMQDTRLVTLTAVRDRLPSLLAEARAQGCHVLIDTAPLGTVGDAVLLLDGVDELLIVVRTGHTTLPAIDATRDALEHVRRPPSGFAVIGDVVPSGVVYRQAHVRRGAEDGGPPPTGGRLLQVKDEAGSRTPDAVRE